MHIQTFSNMRGIIHGQDTKRIDCDKSGVLRIGNTEVRVVAEGDTVLPLLFHGATGRYAATFALDDGSIYDLGNINIRKGRVVSPPPMAVEIMELRCRAERLEATCEELRRSIDFLSHIFDTDSLNFLIK